MLGVVVGQLASMQEMIRALQASASEKQAEPAPQTATTATAEADPEKQEMREALAALQSQMAQFMSANQQPAAPPSAANPEAARRPRGGFQRKAETSSA